MRDDDLDASIVGAAFSRRVVGDRQGLAGTVRDDQIRWEIRPHGIGAALRQVDVVLVLALRVGVALDRQVALLRRRASRWGSMQRVHDQHAPAHWKQRTTASGLGVRTHAA